MNCVKCGEENALFELMRYPNKRTFSCRYCGNRTFEGGQTKFEEEEEEETDGEEERD